MSSVDVPFEIRGGRLTNDKSGYNEGEHVHERISALMRENEQNNISMRTLQVSSNMKRVNHLFLLHLSLHTELLHDSIPSLFIQFIVLPHFFGRAKTSH